MGVHVYESHLGGWFATDRLISDNELYCETCGDWDVFVGCYDSLKYFLECNADDINIDGDDGYYKLSDVMDRISYMFDDTLTHLMKQGLLLKHVKYMMKIKDKIQ